MPPQVAVNPWAVLLCGVAYMIIGFLWYSNAMFGKIWTKGMGITHEQMEKNKSKGMAVTFLVSFISSLVMAYVFKHFASYAGATTVSGGMQAAFWAWLGFVAPAMLGSVLYEQRKVHVYLINTGYYLVSMLVMGAILVAVP